MVFEAFFRELRCFPQIVQAPASPLVLFAPFCGPLRLPAFLDVVPFCLQTIEDRLMPKLNVSWGDYLMILFALTPSNGVADGSPPGPETEILSTVTGTEFIQSGN